MGNKTGLAVAVGIAAVVCAAPTASAGEQSPSFVAQVFGGTVLNVPTTLTLSQAGFPDLEHDANWTSKSLDQPFYWALRLRWQQPDSGWELQLLHHKLILENTTADIRHFEVTHGFNLLTAHRVWRRERLHLRLGAGVVLPHAESTVRGRYAATGAYRIRGPAAMAGAGWEQPIVRGVVATAEAQAIAASAKVDIADGRARVVALGLHVLLGLGAAF